MKTIITVTCPECGGLLEIDVARERVLGCRFPSGLSEDPNAPEDEGKDKAVLLDEAVEKVRDRQRKGDALFDEALKNVEDSEKKLDALFGEVKKKVAEEKKKPPRKDPDPRDLFWD